MTAAALEVDPVDRVVVPPEDQTTMLTRHQMAKVLNVSVSTLDRWSTEPGFPVLRGPRFVRFDRKLVMEHMERMARLGLSPSYRRGQPLPPPPRKKGKS